MPIAVNTITDAAGSGAPNFPNGFTANSLPSFPCRAWVNFDATKDSTGATSTANTNRLILAGGNVSSVLRTGTGVYLITFTTAMPDAKYAVNIDTQTSPANGPDAPAPFYDRTPNTQSAPSASSFLMSMMSVAGVAYDRAYVMVSVFR